MTIDEQRGSQGGPARKVASVDGPSHHGTSTSPGGRHHERLSESQPALAGVLVAQQHLLHVTEETPPARREWRGPWNVVHQGYDATVSPTSSFETAESQQQCRPGTAIDEVARRY
jgi:hypothetical protein